jgi:hypothetical protein
VRYKFVIALTVLAILASGLFLFNGCSKPVPVTESNIILKAAIIDQLDTLYPNQDFNEQCTKLLVQNGFTVDIIRGDEVTVDFMRALPEKGYQLIIFRAHAGILGTEDKLVQKTYLFTNESYSETKYTYEQLSDKLAKARTAESSPWVFALGANFINKSMKDQFDRSVILMMGCATLNLDDMAKAFIEKGSSAYLGWNASVGIDYVDSAMLILLKKVLTRETTIESAVTATRKEAGNDPTSGAILGCYPTESGAKTLSELIKTTR